MKVCTKCGEEKSEGEFRQDKSKGGRKRRLCSQCKSCMAEWYRKYYEENPEKQKLRGMREKLRAYGLTLADYDELYDAQDGVCAICCQPEPNQRLSVDHDHGTGEVRGLLCLKCNSGLGFFSDCPNRLRVAAEYLDFFAAD